MNDKKKVSKVVKKKNKVSSKNKVVKKKITDKKSKNKVVQRKSAKKEEKKIGGSLFSKFTFTPTLEKIKSKLSKIIEYNKKELIYNISDKSNLDTKTIRECLKNIETRKYSFTREDRKQDFDREIYALKEILRYDNKLLRSTEEKENKRMEDQKTNFSLCNSIEEIITVIKKQLSEKIDLYLYIRNKGNLDKLLKIEHKCEPIAHYTYYTPEIIIKESSKESSNNIKKLIEICNSNIREGIENIDEDILKKKDIDEKDIIKKFDKVNNIIENIYYKIYYNFNILVCIYLVTKYKKLLSEPEAEALAAFASAAKAAPTSSAPEEASTEAAPKPATTEAPPKPALAPAIFNPPAPPPLTTLPASSALKPALELEEGAAEAALTVPTQPQTPLTT